ncbi:MAG: TonB-dependent receptor plug domain-containing protein [Saprospiraceae bacterium]|nr:TonB-dependent receptor plug domain-containing protein [Saprospiraceae bacterium]
MKKILFFCLLLASIALTTSCDTSSRASTDSNPMSQQFNNSLADVLRKNTGLQVMGSGDNVQILVRGITSIKLNTQPLYVVDGVPIGNDYSAANNLVNPNDITDVKVLRSASELTQWGENGNNGVIIIKTKNNAKN